MPVSLADLGEQEGKMQPRFGFQAQNRRPRTVVASLVPRTLCERDELRISSDVYEDLFEISKKHNQHELGAETDRYVAIKAAEKDSQWVIFRADIDRSLPPSTIGMGSTSSHLANAALLNGTVLVHKTSPVVLDHVVLTFSAATYDQAKAKYETEGSIESLDTTLMRHGDYDVSKGFSVKVCEPVDQGRVVKSRTRITVIRAEDTEVKEVAATDEDANVELEISKFLSFEELQVELAIRALEQPVDYERLVPRPDRSQDPEVMAFVKVEQLAKIGCFSGDLVSLKSGSIQRTLRLFSFPEPNTAAANALYISPFLLYNIGSISHGSISRLDNSASVNVATEVTISRLAAPSTTDRTLQPACLAGLRTYFESFKRVVKEGDVLAIPIDTIMAQTLQNVSPPAPTSGGGASGQPTATSAAEEDLGVLPAGQPNDVAWYKITALASKSESNGVECIIDPTSTRMVQSGLVTEKVPTTNLGWRRYLSLPNYPEFGNADNNFVHAKKLRQILSASLLPGGNALQTTILVQSSKRGAGKSTLVRSVAGQCGVHCFDLDCYALVGDTDVKTIGSLRARLDRAAQISPVLVLLRHLDVIAKKSEQDGGDTGIVANLIDVFADYSSKKNVIIAATVADVDKMSEAIRSKFKFEITVPVPSESERKTVFAELTKYPMPNKQLSRGSGVSVPFAFALRSDVSLSNLALQSAGLTPPDLASIIEIAKTKAIDRLRKVEGAAIDDLIVAYGGLVKMTPEDLESSISEARTKYSDSIGAPRIPNVGWEDVGGLDGVKKEILDTIEMPLKYPQLFAGGMKKRSGILFYGPPGTGKTLLAKAIATSFSLNFFSVKGPELLNMYIGESEANVRKVFQKARDAKPCVVFFDELDSVAPKRGNQGDSGGVMDRIVSQLLAELDGMSGAGGDGVFVVGATNRPDLLDEALLRPGRFDKMLYLGISDTTEKQQKILEALTRKFTIDQQVDLHQVAEKCPFTYTGADFYALSSDAMLNAMTRTAGTVDEKIKQYNADRETPVSTQWWFQNAATEIDTKVLVTAADFDKAQRELVPSVSAEELQHYLRIRENFEGGKKKPSNQTNGTIHEQPNGHYHGKPTEANKVAAVENGAESSSEYHSAQESSVESPSVVSQSKTSALKNVLSTAAKKKKNKGKEKA